MARLMVIFALAITTFFARCTSGNSSSLNTHAVSRLTQVMPMHEFRSSHTATLLRDGRVLVTGGFKKGPDRHSQLYSNTAEIFNPENQTFSQIESMHEQRCAHTATILPDGNILVAGGYNGEHLSSAELFDVKSGHWKQLPSLMAPRSGHQAVLLPNNKVLFIGGSPGIKSFAELFNISTRQFEQPISAPFNPEGANVTVLQNGNILVAGGNMNNEPVQYALIYDFKKNNFTRVEDMSIVRHKSASALLPNGNVLIIAGSNNRDWKGKYKSTEIFNVQTNSFQKGPDLNYERFKLMNSVITTNTGNIIITGGDKHIEMLKPGSDRFQAVAELEQPLYYSCATALNNRDVLITGGYGNDVQSQNKAWMLRLQ